MIFNIYVGTGLYDWNMNDCNIVNVILYLYPNYTI